MSRHTGRKQPVRCAPRVFAINRKSQMYSACHGNSVHVWHHYASEACSSSMRGFVRARGKRDASPSTSYTKLRSEHGLPVRQQGWCFSFRREQIRLDTSPCTPLWETHSCTGGSSYTRQLTDRRICLNSLRRDMEGSVLTYPEGLPDLCKMLHILPLIELPPEEGAVAEISAASALTPEQDLLQAVNLRVCQALAGGSIIWLDSAMAWLLDMQKSNGFDSVTDKHLRASLWVVLQDITRLLACGICPYTYALPGNVKYEYLVSLYQAARRGES